MNECPKCRGTLHVRTPAGRVRCTCIRAALNRSYILPAVREADTDATPGPTLPLETGVHRGDWRKFRHAVWRTLLLHEPSGFSYDFIRADRLVDIQMERETGLDSGYDGFRALEEIGLVVLQVSLLSDNKMFGSLFLRLVEERERYQRPTWVFLSTSPNAFYNAFKRAGDDFVDAARAWFERQQVTVW